MTDISALEGYAGQLSEAAAQAKAASAKQALYVDGDAQQDVDTEAGLVPTLAKQARLADEKIDAALTDVAAQMAGAMTYASVAAGLAGTGDGGFFSVPAADVNEYIILYKNVTGAAVEIKRYPSSAALQEVLGMIVSRDVPAASRPFFSVTDEAGFTALDVADDSIKTRDISITGDELSASGYKADMTSADLSVMDEYGYCSVHVGGQAMKALADLAEYGGGSAEAGVAYAPIAPSRHKIVAHRGLHLSGVAPENSLDAYRLAAQAGYRYVETDITRTADGRYVLCHDDSINRTFIKQDGSAIGSTVKVGESSLADLRSLYKLSSATVRFQRPIPLLEEFLAVCSQYGLYPFIELKDPSFVSADFDAVNKLCVEALGNEFMFISGSPTRLAAVRAINPKVMLGYIYNELTEEFYNYALQNAPACIDINYTGLTADWVARARRDGMLVSAWTVPATAFDTVAKLGVEYITADNVAPSLDRQAVLFSDNSSGAYSAYTSTGPLANGLVSLASGQTLTLAKQASVSLGGAYLILEYSGALSVSLGGQVVALSSAQGDVFRTQALMVGVTPDVVITGGTGGGVVREISVAVANFN